MKMRTILMMLVITAAFGMGLLVNDVRLPLAHAVVTDAEAIRVTNEVVRPLAEDMRALYYRLLSVKNTYGGQLNTLFPAGGGAIEDGREAEGVSRLTSDDARKILLFADTYITAYETAGVAEMTKPTVRRLEVQ